MSDYMLWAVNIFKNDKLYLSAHFYILPSKFHLNIDSGYHSS